MSCGLHPGAQITGLTTRTRGFPAYDEEAEQAPTVPELLHVVPRPDTVKLENYLTEESVAYYAALGLDKAFALAHIPSWVYAPGAFLPVPLQPIKIDDIFHAEDHFDHVAMVELLCCMVHPNVNEVVRGAVPYVAVIPDFILEDDACLRLLDLKN